MKNFKKYLQRIKTSNKTYDRETTLLLQVEEYKQNKRKRYVQFEIIVDTFPITFELLQKISKLLGTRNINLKGRTDEHHYSKYTWDETQYVEIECNDVDFEKTEEKIEKILKRL